MSARAWLLWKAGFACCKMARLAAYPFILLEAAGFFLTDLARKQEHPIGAWKRAKWALHYHFFHFLHRHSWWRGRVEVVHVDQVFKEVKDRAVVERALDEAKKRLKKSEEECS